MTRRGFPSRKQRCCSFFITTDTFRRRSVPNRKIDDANQLVNITFIVQRGKQARIGNVVLNGARRAEQTWLAAQTALAPRPVYGRTAKARETIHFGTD